MTASSYSEPDTGKPARWHWFAVNGDDDRRLFAFPGIWQRWNGPLKKDCEPVEADVYSFLTTEPNELTRSINHERMPVPLSTDKQFETWLSGSPAEAFALARSFDPALTRIVQGARTKKIYSDTSRTKDQLPLLLCAVVRFNPTRTTEG